MSLVGDNADKVLAAHAAAMEHMSTNELAKLLISMGPQHDEDDWFRELIVEEIKKRKP